MIQKFAKMSKTAWIEKLENDLSVMRLAPKKFKREIAEKEAILSVLNAVDDKCPVKISFSDITTIIEGILYGEVDGEISSTKDLLEFLNKNKDRFVVLTDYEEDTTNEKL
ncbi:TPA: hypothetical protein QFP15_001158 [Enterococcus faecium]|uniref:hypothetical protein n=2 Tax=Enterococcus faecium TaxID=1352 RepID=UPI0002825C13|nr:hypothetical protein [Enterococcus faecium]VTQ70810.1 Uncharacterised protein [Enterococcus hirae]EJX61438.1 hypothetical protein HMPREF1375_02437 [Enterococcus faecium P1986]EOF93528.1 hypothetical protein SKK_02786 [Enterococcus faecium EnGen0168]KGK72941.1 hypothetical protein LM26_13450 [Enterococcus faecium]MBG7919057.1 hypothetical protein [Enterococcus faecium]